MSRTTAARLPLGDEIVRPTFNRERYAMKNGLFPVAGCDEAGRGPLAGPVVAAAVILDPKRIPRGLNDSKKLSPEQRAALYEKICSSAEVAVAVAPPARIESLNIRGASLWALARAVKALTTRPKLVFVDGIDRIDIDCECRPVVSGDALVVSISAASIVAKATVSSATWAIRCPSTSGRSISWARACTTAAGSRRWRRSSASPSPRKLMKPRS
jgi:ribonuclease HII